MVHLVILTLTTPVPDLTESLITILEILDSYSSDIFVSLLCFAQ